MTLRAGTRLGPCEVLGLIERDGWLLASVGLGGLSFVLSPRMLVPAGEVRRARAASETAGRRDRGVARSRRWTAVVEVLRTSGVLLGVTLGGLVFILSLPIGDAPFRVLQTFMLVWLYVLPALWTSSWLAAGRVFRCLPLSGNRLALFPLVYALLICLVEAVAVVLVLAVTDHPADRFTPLLWWLLLCPGSLALFHGLTFRVGSAANPQAALGVWTVLVTTGSVSRDIVGIFDFYGGGPGFGAALGPSWSGAVGGLGLAVLGFLVLRRHLAVRGDVLRPVPAARQW